MFGYSQIKHEVFTVSKELSDKGHAQVDINTQISRLNELTPKQWKQLRELQGQFSVLYLRFRYGSPKTYILLAYVEDILAHIEWIVPAQVIKSRYPFVYDNSYSVISCFTAAKFRGKGIYPSQIQKVVESDIPARTFWIWTASTNMPSLKGIRKAGGVKVGEFVQKRWFWGCMSHIEYFTEGSNCK